MPIDACLAFAKASTIPRFNWLLALAGAGTALIRFLTVASSLIGDLGILASAEAAGVEFVHSGVSTKYIGNLSGNFSGIFSAL